MKKRYTWTARPCAPYIGDDTPAADPANIGKQTPPTTPAADKKLPEIDENFNSESDDPVNITQKDLSRIIGGLRKKMRGSNEQLASELQALSQQANMTKEERDRLNKLLEQSRSTFQTELERQQAESTKLSKELETTQKRFETETTAWRKRFESTLIDNTVAAACGDAGVFNPKQMRDLLDRHLLVEQSVDDKGNSLDDFKVVVRTKADDGSPVNLPVKDFLQKMDQSGQHVNLFNHSMKRGTAQSGGSGAGDGAGAPPEDPKALVEWLKVPENRARLLAQSAN